VHYSPTHAVAVCGCGSTHAVASWSQLGHRLALSLQYGPSIMAWLRLCLATVHFDRRSLVSVCVRGRRVATSCCAAAACVPSLLTALLPLLLLPLLLALLLLLLGAVPPDPAAHHRQAVHPVWSPAGPPAEACQQQQWWRRPRWSSEAILWRLWIRWPRLWAWRHWLAGLSQVGCSACAVTVCYDGVLC
jgi:hypothetical protein